MPSVGQGQLAGTGLADDERVRDGAGGGSRGMTGLKPNTARKRTARHDMTRRVTFTPLAEADLESIGDYIAQDNPRRALSFLAELRAQCSKIANAPQAYQARPGGHPLREQQPLAADALYAERDAVFETSGKASGLRIDSTDRSISSCGQYRW